MSGFGEGDFGEGLFGGEFTFTTDLLDNLAPMLYAEEETGDALATYLTALATPFELVEEWASDTDDAVGWSLLVDIDRCPDIALPWLAQLVGIKTRDITGLTADQQRQQIRDLGNWKRGTIPAIRAAVLPYLTGTQTIIIRERFDGSANDAPYNIQVITYASETSDAVKVEAAIRAQKAAGLVLSYVNSMGQDLQSVKVGFATLQDVKSTYATLAGVKSATPGV